MQTFMKVNANPRVILCAETAADLMTPNPASLRDRATIGEAVRFLTDKGFSAAAVIDEAGRPIGVLSRSDILVHDREKVEYVPRTAEFYEREEWSEVPEKDWQEELTVQNVDRTLVQDIMTPIVFSVRPETPAAKVIEDMLGMKVHRLFVVDRAGVLLGVISALDVLRYLRPETTD
jgi:CBS-domain-containing membrane protein